MKTYVPSAYRKKRTEDPKEEAITKDSTTENFEENPINDDPKK